MERAFVFTLSELLGMLGEAIDAFFPSPVWVTAEIADLRFDQSGHCYLELVEKRENEFRARARGTIWASLYPSIATSFSTLTGRSLSKGMEILALVKVRFHPVYGLSLDIRDIDPQYSLGAMMRHKKEVLLRLTQEGLVEENRRLPFPLVPQRLAVLSSPHAAGFGDFVAHLEENPYGFRFFVELFPAFVQGEETESSLLCALEQVKERAQEFDALVILRGGGSQSDLHWFDSYALGRSIATFPLPVLVGIGHQKDETVLDAVAYLSLKTPTAVADFLIERVREFDELVLEEAFHLLRATERALESGKSALSVLLSNFERRVRYCIQEAWEGTVKLEWQTEEYVSHAFEKACETLKDTWQRFGGALERMILNHASFLDKATHAVALLDPQNVLRRGYTLTFQRGKIVRSARECILGIPLKTQFSDGWVTSEVKTRDVL